MIQVTRPTMFISTQFKYNNSGGCGGDDLRGTCAGRVVSPEFGVECTASSLPYDIDPKNHADQTLSGKIMSTKVGWNTTTPNTFKFTTVLKNTADCIGHYAVRHCTYRAAHVSYPVELFPTSELRKGSPLIAGLESGANVSGWHSTLILVISLRRSRCLV